MLGAGCAPASPGLLVAAVLALAVLEADAEDERLTSLSSLALATAVTLSLLTSMPSPLVVCMVGDWPGSVTIMFWGCGEETKMSVRWMRFEAGK